MKNWKQIKQTAKQTRTEKDQKIVADELTNQRQEALKAAHNAHDAAAITAAYAVDAANAAYKAEITRINKEYPL